MTRAAQSHLLIIGGHHHGMTVDARAIRGDLFQVIGGMFATNAITATYRVFSVGVEVVHGTLGKKDDYLVLVPVDWPDGGATLSAVVRSLLDLATRSAVDIPKDAVRRLLQEGIERMPESGEASWHESGWTSQEWKKRARAVLKVL